MKFSIYTVVVALAAYVAAEPLEPLEERDSDGTPARCNGAAKKIPKCARPAITKCTKKAGCGARDYACGCKHKSQITKCATSPVLAACGEKKGLEARKAAAKLCKCVHK